MRKLHLVISFLFLVLSIKAQTLEQAKESYSKACTLETSILNNIKAIDTEEDSINQVILNLEVTKSSLRNRKKALTLELPTLSKDKQNLLSIINVEQNRVQLDGLQTKLVDLINQLNLLRTQNTVIKPACEGN